MGLVLKLAPGSFIKQMKTGLSEADCEVLDRPEVLHNLVMSLKEGFSNPKGVHLDTRLMVSPWGFSPEQTKQLPFPVRLWYGGSDHLAPIAMGRYLARAITNSRLKIFPGEGHMSLIVNNIGEILQVLSDDISFAIGENSTVNSY
jgi:pimeloyl-ACP methyl ester carboxylesterase